MSRWYYMPDTGQRMGPVTAEQLRQLALTRTVRPEHMVMREGIDKWVPAAKVRGLFPRTDPAEGAANLMPAETPAPGPPAATEEDVLEVVAADDAPTVEPADDIVTVEPADDVPPLDPSGRFYVSVCAGCQRRVRVPVAQRGCVSRCPTCQLFFRVWGRPRRGVADGLPVTLRVSAHLLQWPTACACCLRPHDHFLQVRHYRQCNLDGTQAVAVLAIWAFKGTAALGEALPHDSWQVPYCWDCLEHVKSRDEEDMHRRCCTVQPAVEYHGYEGTVHCFSFHNWQYANRFLVLNHEKCLL